MEFSQKSEYSSQLASSAHIDADKQLLTKHAPDDSLLNAIGNDADFDKQLLWVLLDYCSPEKIKEFRGEKKQTVKGTPSQVKQKVNELFPKKKSKKKKNTLKLAGIISKTKLFRKPS